jgi:hypothetical protein
MKTPTTLGIVQMMGPTTGLPTLIPTVGTAIQCPTFTLVSIGGRELESYTLPMLRFDYFPNRLYSLLPRSNG